MRGAFMGFQGNCACGRGCAEWTWRADLAYAGKDVMPSRGFMARLVGPHAKADLGARALFLPADAPALLVKQFSDALTDRTAGMQILVQFPDFEPAVVNFHRERPGSAALFTFFKGKPGAELPSLAGVCLLLSGRDAQADEQVIQMVERGTDATGKPFRDVETVCPQLWADVRPLLAMIFFNESDATDPLLRTAAESMARVFFAKIGVV